MHAISILEPGGPEVLSWREAPDPAPGPGEALVDVAASAVNRADVLQRLGFYPPPEGAPEYPGLEASGTIGAVGRDVDDWAPGDEVCALLSGGGYAERVAVARELLLPVPEGTSVVEAAALPEVVCTVWSNVFMIAGLRPGERFLVHGGGSGIGTMAIQLAKQRGAEVTCTVGTEEKARRCVELGADHTVNYRTEDFVRAGEFDVILDNMGAKYLDRNITALAPGGRLVVIGMQGGTKAELDINKLLRKRASLHATSLRARPLEEKAAIVASVKENVWPLLEAGTVRPVIDRVLPLPQAGEAHRIMESSGHFGKILLKTGES